MYRCFHSGLPNQISGFRDWVGLHEIPDWGNRHFIELNESPKLAPLLRWETLFQNRFYSFGNVPTDC